MQAFHTSHHRVGPRFIVATPINNDCSNAMMVVPGRILAYELAVMMWEMMTA